MKEKTSVTLSSEVLARLDRLAGPKLSRSAVLENILQHYFRQLARKELQARDLTRINRVADRLNSEAEDVLSYQFEDFRSDR